MSLLVPTWVTNPNISSVTSTREQGVSQAPYDGLNIGTHVGDSADNVALNRQILKEKAAMPSSPIWLNQTHSTNVAIITDITDQIVDADAAYTQHANIVLSAMTADCLPILIASKDGQEIAAIHAGWRGLADGIVENTLNCFSGELQAWIGPAIGYDAFEIGGEVKAIFCGKDSRLEQAFKAKPSSDKWLADLAFIAQLKLEQSGVTDITQSALCTYSDPQRFFSYRRDGQTGRMASFIWMQR
ncbi:multi-copper polyphenol oxidoreductase [Vibrio sp. 10N.286.49.C2]|uniref:peptidoglycan editing factor PgeF n=1 Tax=unclassified Vibrio TaxID=2614977 RepID=UPI000C815607|nr:MULTISPECIES: peptidoglycan editing factor PgeF [unclassified Vibrio]PMH36798.1 multi-copper polyphenol oxidoreductase [Vibrio sp. 10N.286.49.C2]PMH51320.1 multi-copper polyphenol oxidoreductase [Vibrio sp. 10N.286.49.B1]PMH80334.1 multi-copper polyphenol oxidoreductase [Vibrio sp. 10N.286.48.B7]